MALKRLKAAVIAMVLMSGFVAVPMAANAGSELCPAVRACIYVEPDFYGLLGYRAGGLGIHTVSAGADNKTSSWENKTGNTGAWYSYAGGGGSCYVMRYRTELDSIPFPNYDKLTSWRTNGGC